MVDFKRNQMRISLIASFSFSALFCVLIYSRSFEAGHLSQQLVLEENDSAFNAKDYEGIEDNNDDMPSMNAESVQKYLDRLDQDITSLEKRLSKIKDSDFGASNVNTKQR